MNQQTAQTDEHHPSPARLAGVVRQGGRAVAIAQVLSQFVSLAVLAVLLRLLGPDPFGLIGMVLPLLLLGRTLTAWGLPMASVQQRTLSHHQATSLFWITLALGLFLGAAIAALAPLVAWFYGRHELLALTLMLAATAPLYAVGLQHQALLERKLHLAQLTWSRLAAQALGGIAAVVVAIGANTGWQVAAVAALVVQQYVELLALAVLVWWLDDWRPGRPRRGENLGDMLRFGTNYTASGFVFTLEQQLDKVLVGLLLGTRALGLYGQAFNVMMKPVLLTSTALTGMMFPALSRARDDRGTFAAWVVAFNRVVAILLLPAGAGLAVVAPETMWLLGGSEWQAAGPLLAALAGVILVRGFINIAGSVLAAVGRTDRLLRGALALVVGMLPGVLLGWVLGNYWEQPLLGLACGYAVTYVAMLFPGYLVYVLRGADVSVGDWWDAVRRPLVAAVAMGAVVALAKSALLFAIPAAGPLPRLIILLAIGGLTYAALARDELRWLVAQWRTPSSANRT